MSTENSGGSAENTATESEVTLESMEQAEIAEQQTEQSESSEKTEPVAEEKTLVKEEKVVPYGALHEERMERQRLARELKQEREQTAQTMARMNQRLEQLANPPKQIPGVDVDPVANFDHRLNEVSQNQRQILEVQQQRDQQAAQHAAVQRLAGAVVSSVQSFAKDKPDYQEAINFLDDFRVRELQVFGVPEDQARQQAVQERDTAALQWAHGGQNAAELAYSFAKARGFQGKAVQSPAQKIEAQQKGQLAARSLGGGGAVTAGKLTAEAIANMSNEEFEKLSASDWKKAMGG